MTRTMMRRAIAPGLLALFALASPAHAAEYSLSVEQVMIETGQGQRLGVGYNGASPGPLLSFEEGEEAVIHVTNNLPVDTSVHWHGLILPFTMDGVPGVSFDGIKPGETFTYRFPIKQSGTYWYHSHSGMQEGDGAYGPIVIKPKGREPYRYDRDYVVQFTDAHPHSGHRIARNLKMSADYYNRNQRTLFDFVSDAGEKGLGAALSDRKDWGDMRMMPSDIEDVQGFTPLINGETPDQNWTALFEPGQRVRLRFINSSAMAFLDIRIPGLKMTVVQADGNDVRPVTVDELRIAVAETYDVIVRPTEDRAYTIFAESMGRSAFARGTLAPREGMEAEIPAMRQPPLLTMADMGMAHDMAGMDHGAMGHGAMTHTMPDGTVMNNDAMAGMDHSAMGHDMAGMDHAAMGHDMAAPADPFYAPGSGLTPKAAEEGGKFLSYADLKAQKPLYPVRAPDRELEIRLTGNMERYIWSINGVKYADSEPIRLKYGERVRFKLTNETMMTHPMHLHGMWSILDNDSGEWNPVKHVVSVAPGMTVYMETEVDAPGKWVFHCHLMQHMDAGMFRDVIVEGGPDQPAAGVEG